MEVFHKLLRTWCTTAVDQHGFLNEAPEDAEGVVKRPVGFLQKKAVGASENDGSSLALALGDARHLGDLFLVHSVSLRFSVFLLGCRGRLLGLLLDFGRRLLGLGWRRFGGRRLR